MLDDSESVPVDRLRPLAAVFDGTGLVHSKAFRLGPRAKAMRDASNIDDYNAAEDVLRADNQAMLKEALPALSVEKEKCNESVDLVMATVMASVSLSFTARVAPLLLGLLGVRSGCRVALCLRSIQVL